MLIDTTRIFLKVDAENHRPTHQPVDSAKNPQMCDVANRAKVFVGLRGTASRPLLWLIFPFHSIEFLPPPKQSDPLAAGITQ